MNWREGVGLWLEDGYIKNESNIKTFKSIITSAFESLPWKFVIMQPSSSPSQACTLHSTRIGGDDTKVSNVDHNSYQTMRNVTKHLHDDPFPKEKVVVNKLWQITITYWKTHNAQPECWPQLRNPWFEG